MLTPRLVECSDPPPHHLLTRGIEKINVTPAAVRPRPL